MRTMRECYADVFVLALLGANAVLNPPDLRFLSAGWPLPPGFDGDVLSGLAGCAGMGLMLALAALMVSSRRHATTLRVAIVATATALWVLLPALSDMGARARFGIQSGGRYFSFPHDGGVLQTEAATRLLLSGHNPYAANYGGTEMALSHHSQPALWHSMGLAANPAFSFFPYPPLVLFVTAPFQLAARAAGATFDERVIYLGALAVMGFAAWSVPRTPTSRLLLTSFVLLCPWNVRFLVQGYNDVLCVALLVVTAALLRRGRSGAAGAALALACGAKQFAWPAVPLYLAWAWARTAPGTAAVRRGAWLRAVLPMFVLLAVQFLPFLLWSPPALLRSLVTAQTNEYPFRLQGFGLSNLFIARGWVPRPTSNFPTAVPLALLVLPVLGRGVMRLRHDADPARLLALHALAVMILLMFSRHFAANYLFLPAVLFLAAVLLAAESAASDPDLGAVS